MKSVIKSIIILFSFFMCILLNNSLWQVNWWDTWTDPTWILDATKSSIQDTRLDNVNWRGVYWVLRSINANIWPYLTWWVTIWLSLAFLLIIANWIYLSIAPLNEQAISSVKKRMRYIFIWVLIISWFTIIIRVLLSVLANVT